MGIVQEEIDRFMDKIKADMAKLRKESYDEGKADALKEKKLPAKKYSHIQ